VVTVLFADLVGFTGLAESRDPEHVKNLLDRCFQRLVADIEAFGGRVDKIVGDAVVALFGAPLAHEDDAERAVRAALRMQHTLASAGGELGLEVRMRIGVNTGEVLVGSLRAGGDNRAGGDYTAMGDVVNTANRLQAAAEPGQVVVGPATYAATRRVIRYESLGAFQAKGREEPVPAWLACSAILPPGYRPQRARTSLVGREAELGMLRGAVEVGLTRRRASLLVLLGEAGIGKSRLAEELATRLRRDHGALVLEGRCVPYGEANVWWPVADALRHGCGIGPSDPEDRARELTRAAVLDALHLGPAEPHAEEVDRVAAGLAHLMGHDSPLRAIDPTRAREEATAALVAFAEHVTAKRPLLLALSDLHWADDLVLGLLDRLLERLGSRRFVLLATARRSLEERWSPPAGRHNALTLTLDPLSVEAAAEMLGALVGDAPAELTDALLARAGGNPLFLEELVALLTESGALGDGPGRPGVPAAGALAAGDLPDTLRGLVAARLDGLGTVERQVLECCSILGRKGPVTAVTTMAGYYVAPGDVGPALEALEAKELLVLGHEGDEDTWAFRSDLVREVAYGTLTKGDRAKGHAGIARWIEHHEDLTRDAMLSRVTQHWTRAAEIVAELGPLEGVPADAVDRALSWIQRAADRAEASEEPLVAARLYAEGLALVPGRGDDRHRVMLLGRARARAALREIEGARADAEAAHRAAVLAGDLVGEARALLVLGDVAQKGSAWDEADDLLVRATARFEELGDAAGEAEALRLRGFGAMFRADLAAAQELLEAAQRRFVALGDRRGEAWALQNLAWCAFYGGRAHEAETRLRTAIEVFSDLGDRGGQAWARGLLAYARFMQGYLDEAEALAEQVREATLERGEQWGLGMMLVLTASVRLWTGRTCSAVERAGEAAELFDRIGDVFGAMQAGAVRGRALVCAGRIEEGLAQLDEVVRLAVTDRDRTFAQVARIGALVQLGESEVTAGLLAEGEGIGDVAEDALSGELAVSYALHLLQSGQPEAAARVLEALGTQAPERRGAYLGAVQALADAALGRADEVGPLADEVRATQGATYLDVVLAELARAMAAVAAGDRVAGIEAVREAQAVAGRTEDRVAQALANLGPRLVASGGAPAEPGLGEPGEGEPGEGASFEGLGRSAPGWQRALGLAAGIAPTVAG
jgi:class 3 adenylate cyclase/tetratricopeptide (TPR) repeat protein